MRASAPGKLILAGEYAVLRGDLAVVTAVDRRAVATLALGRQTPLIQAVARALRAAGLDEAAARGASACVDTTALVGDAGKLGLGSSAAVAVAATALALGSTADRAAIQALAAAAHADDQGRRGAPGSGADVAAATWGGTFAFASGTVTPLALPADLTLIPYFTGTSADTAPLVAAVARGGATAPRAHAAALDAIAAAARELAAAATAGAAIAAFAAGGAAIAALAAATGAPLEPAGLARVRAAAAALGGAAKTTGAGGGDVALVALPAGVDPTPVHAAIAAAGGTVLDLALGAPGVTIDA